MNKLHIHTRLLLTLLFLLTTTVVMGQENKVPLTVVDSWPTVSLWGTRPENTVDQDPTVNWSIEGNYTLLSYIQLKNVDDTPNGKRSWIEIPYVPKQNTKVEVCFENTHEVFDANGTCAQSIFYSGTPRNGSGMAMEITNHADNHHFNCITSLASHRDGRGQAESTKQTYLLSAAGIQQRGADGNVTMLSSFSNEEIRVCNDPKKANLCFFSHPTADPNTHMSYAGRIYYAKIYEGEELMFDLVPVKDGLGNDARSGFYDKLTNKFYPFFEMVDYVENIVGDNAKNNVHVKIPLNPDPDAGYVWSKSLVKNGYFTTDDMQSFGTNHTTKEVVNITGGTYGDIKALKVVSEDMPDGGVNYYSQLYIKLDEMLVPGDKYYVSFYYKANTETDVVSQAHSIQGTYYGGFNVAPHFTNEWQKGVWEGTVTASGDKSGIGVIALSLSVLPTSNTYYITNVDVRKQEMKSWPNIPAADANYQWTDNLVTNGNLETDNLTAFTVSGTGVTRKNAYMKGANAIEVVSGNGTEDYSSQLYVALDDEIKAGEKFVLSFDYMAEAEADIRVYMQGTGPQQGFTTLSCGTNWKHADFTGTITEGIKSNLTFHLNVLRTTNKYYITNIVVKKQVIVHDPGKKWSENLVNTYEVSGDGTTVTENGSEVSVYCPGTLANSWDSQFFINLKESLVPGEKYFITFSCKADVTNPVSSYLLPEAGQTVYDASYSGATSGLSFDTEWKEYALDIRTVSTNIPEDNPPLRIGFNINLFGTPITYQFKDIVVKKQIDDTSVPQTEPTPDSGKMWSKSLIKNGYFSTSDMSSFAVWPNSGATATTSSIVNGHDGGKAVEVISNLTDGNTWDSNFNFTLDDAINPGDKYYITFDYKADKNASIVTAFNNSGGQIAYNPISLPQATTEWQTYSSGALTNNYESDIKKVVLMLNASQSKKKFYFANIVVKKIVPIDEEYDRSATQLNIDFKNLYNGDVESYSYRHLFSLGTHEDGVMALTTELGHYNYVSGRNTTVTPLHSENNTNDINSRSTHSATFTASKCTIDKTDYNVSGTQTWVHPNALYLMGTHSVSSHDYAPRSFVGQIHKASLIENGILVYDLQPARDAEGNFGFFDKIGLNFYKQDGCAGSEEAGKLDGQRTTNTEGITSSGKYSLEVETPSPILPKRFMIHTATHTGDMVGNTANNPKNWRLMASNDGENWTQLELGEIRPALSSVSTQDVDISSGQTYQYLYNYETGTFLVGANEWGTRASVATGAGAGRFFPRYKSTEGTYILSNFNSKGQTDMFIDAPNSIWMDRASQPNFNKWTISQIKNTNFYEIGNTEYPDVKLGTHADVINGVSNSRLYLDDKTINTRWAFVSETDYADYQTRLANGDYTSPSTTTPLPYSAACWFTVLNNTVQYSMYRLDVDEIGWGSTLTLSDIAITADYDFKHYEGRVYEGSTANDRRIPENLRWGGESLYPDKWKTQADDNRITGVNEKLQRTHEYEHVIYVLPGKSVELTPFKDFFTTDRYEERYTRWYDYRTDLRSSRLLFEPVKGSNVMALDEGDFAGSVLSSGNRQRGTVARYTAPSSTADILDIIGVEAANHFVGDEQLSWTDGIYQLKEPTLQWRHTFVIKNAKTRETAMLTDNTGYIADNKIKLMCPAGTPFQYPLPYYEYATKDGEHNNATDYYGANDASVFHYKIETWRKNGSKIGSTRLKLDGAKGELIFDEGVTSDNGHVAYSYKEIDGYNRVFYMKNPEVGTYTIKIFALDKWDRTMTLTGVDNGGTPLQLMEYELEVLPAKDAAMVNEETLKENSTYAHQRPETLVQAYGKATTTVDFDEVDKNETYVNAGNHYYKWPWQWENSSYGYVYDDTEHGDYNIYMVVDNSSMARYQSFPNVKDRHYADTGKEGFFFYANAASDPSRMSVLNIGRDFCPNTTVYVSAWVCELQGGASFAETANVIFSFRGVKADGSETLLNSFVTGYVSGGWNTPLGYDETKTNYTDATKNPDNRGKWMHVYYTFKPVISSELASAFDHYIISLENNCTSSFGADYAIDDIRAFVCKPDLKARQTQPLCNGSTSTALEMFADFDKLKEAYAFTEGTNESQKFDYCFLDYEVYENSLQNSYKKLPESDKALYPSLTDWREKASKTTGAFKTAYDAAFAAALLKNTYGLDGTNYGFVTLNTTYVKNMHFDGAGRQVLFPCNATDANMVIGKKYIIAMIPDGTGNVKTASDFKLEDQCASVNTFEVTTSFGEIKIDGNLASDQEGLRFCANQKPIVTINLNGIKQGGEDVKKENAVFDWYLGPLGTTAGYTAYNEEQKSGLYLSNAMEKFREEYPKASDLTSVTPKNDFTQSMLDYIREAVAAKKVILYQVSEALSTTDLYREERKTKFYLTAIPINPTPDDPSILYCLEPLQVSINLDTNSPSMKDGDDQNVVPYPADMNDVPLRIGLKQLKRTVIANLNTTTTDENKLLWLPLRSVTPTAGAAARGVNSLARMADDDLIYLASSTDPAVLGGTSGAIDIMDADGHSTYHSVISDLKVIGKVHSIKAQTGTSNGSVAKLAFVEGFKFREGYEYTLKFHYEDDYTGIAGDHPAACPGDVVFTIKVVPEYQMWTGAVSRNWNDDRNWKRVTKDELLWDDDRKTANADYITDGGTNDNLSSYVPADFTKVIIPTNAPRVPYMYDMHTGNLSGNITFAGAEKESQHRWRASVREGSNPGEYPNSVVAAVGGPSHLISLNMASEDRSSDNSVACRPWYDHTCDQIHFNAGAAMMDQRYLYYNKAWCDIDVIPGTWQTVASPLMNIVAGDLYLPTATARQVTPLFEDITYQTTLNDRFKPAVFQRSWNKSNATVYKLGGGMEDVGIKLDWSHVYNDVNVQYGAGQGFSIKVDVSAMPETDQPGKGSNPATARFRFPKADKQYTYYNPGNTDGSSDVAPGKTEPVNGANIVDGVRPGRLADLTSSFSQQVGDNGNGATSTAYFLVGNPLMCWLDMQQFFAQNTQFEPKYWIATADGQRTALFTEDGFLTTSNENPKFLPPGVSFFVHLKQNQDGQAGASSTVTPVFNNTMMSYTQAEPRQNNADGSPITRASQSAIPQLMLMATDKAGRQTKAVLTDGAYARHSGVETLFDSNLKDDVLIYTTKGGQAMTIADVAAGDTLPLIISGTQDELHLSLRGAEDFETPLYLYDSETGETLPLMGDIELTQNQNGVKYYILADPTSVDDEADTAMPRVVSNGNVLTVTLAGEGNIERIRICRVDGINVTQEVNVGSQFSITLPRNVYIIDMDVDGKHYTVKMAVG
ncbi:MAG: carbohydrate binding domain-containing protein [Bacteroidales bacterium]|nr:carbohydrate binding domain-containing protein [Bacteroidales bacterium]